MKHNMIQTKKAAIISARSSKNLNKVEDLGLKPNTIEQARFEYSPLGKIFNKGLDKDDKKEGLFKRLKNIENAQKNLTKDESKKKLEPIRNEEQSEVLEDKLTVVDKKPKEIVLLKDKLDFIFRNLTRILIVLEKKLIIVICFLKQVISLLLKVVVF